MTLTLNDTLVFHPYFPIADCFCNKVQTENQQNLLYYSHLQPFSHKKLGEKLVFCPKMLYLCTGNRKNSLLCLARVFS